MTDVRELLVTTPLEVYNEDTIVEQCKAARVWLRKGEDSHTWMYSFIGTSEDLAAFLIEQFGIEPDDVGQLMRSYFKDDRARECDGEGWIIVNPDWPSGDDVHRERCSGCDRCERSET